MSNQDSAMGSHTVSAFDEELKQIAELIRGMGGRASQMVADSTYSLLNADTGSAQRVISEDVVMDANQRDLDERAITLIAKRQPMAQDLRAVVAAIRIAADLERIGDLAKNIAKRVGSIDAGTIKPELSHSIELMSNLVLTQIDNVIAYYVSRNASGLVELRAADEKIDIKYTSVFRELLTYMMEDPRKITACTHLLFCAKNLERIGDHVTNVAENAYYVITGEQLPAHRPKVDETVSA